MDVTRSSIYIRLWAHTMEVFCEIEELLEKSSLFVGC